MKSFNQFYEQAGRLIPGGPYSSEKSIPKPPLKKLGPTRRPFPQPGDKKPERPPGPGHQEPLPPWDDPLAKSNTNRKAAKEVSPKKPVYGVIPPESPEEARKASRRAFDMLAGG